MMPTKDAGRQRAADGIVREHPRSHRRRRVRRTVAILITIAVVGGGGGASWYWLARPSVYRPGEEMAEITRNLERDLPNSAPEVRFEDATTSAGLQSFRAFAPPRSSQLPEDMGAGAAWGDYDNDGDDDLFLVGGGAALDVPPGACAPCVLFENLGDGTFRSVTDFPEVRIMGMGAAWGDCDGDGWLDLVVSGYDCLLLFRNHDGRLLRDETFPNPHGFWAGVSWGDYDSDRDLDLYVCGYVQYEATDSDRNRRPKQATGGMVPYTLNPSSYEPERNLLFRNQGDGTFVDVAEQLGVANTEGRSLGALWCDLDQDGHLDLYIANDISDNVLYRNLGGRFVEMSHAATVADYRGAMGLALGDYDRDGDDDIFVTHWIAQENALYDSLYGDLEALAAKKGTAQSAEDTTDVPRSLRFIDLGSALGLGQPALQSVGWGAEFADFDGDGWLDLVVANGSTFETSDTPPGLKPQKSFLFWNELGQAFHDLAPYIDALQEPRVSRGLAVADYDRDGDQDVLLVHLDGGVQLLRNEMQVGNWIEVRLKSRSAGGELTGFGDGASVVATIGDAGLRRAVFSTSYLSQSSRTLHFGLGSAAQVDQLEVSWIGGERETWRDLAAGALWELREGESAAVRIGGGAIAAPEGSERERVVQFWTHQRAAMRAMKVDEDLPRAMELFRKALSIDPAHEDARYYLANCLAATGDAPAARAEFETLIRISPRSHRAQKAYGSLLASSAQNEGELREALAVLEGALAINREETGVLVVMGEVLAMLGRDEAAAEKLEWVCRTNPHAGNAFFLRSYLAWRGGQGETARELLELARGTLGDAWKPEGTTAEGDVRVAMHVDVTPLARFWPQWDGSVDPDATFAALHAFMQQRGVSR